MIVKIELRNKDSEEGRAREVIVSPITENKLMKSEAIVPKIAKGFGTILVFRRGIVIGSITELEAICAETLLILSKVFCGWLVPLI